MREWRVAVPKPPKEHSFLFFFIEILVFVVFVNRSFLM